MNISHELQLSKAIGSKNYSRAIELLDQLLQKNEKALFALTMIALCYEWTGDQENAIKFAEKTLALSPNNFSMHMLSVRHWYKLKDEEKTYYCTCRATEFFEQNEIKVPGFVFVIFRFLSFIPGLNKLKGAESDFEKHNEDEVKQYDWAKEFVKSCEAKHGEILTIS